MKILIRIILGLLVLTLPSLALATPMLGMSNNAAANPLTMPAKASRQGCWIDHVQVQPARSFGATGGDNPAAAVALGRDEAGEHLGSEHWKPDARRSAGCSKRPEPRPTE